MLGPRSVTAAFAERYPRTSRVMYELLLILITFELMLSIVRYDSNPKGSPPVYDPPSANSTVEHICSIAAREVDVPVGPLRYVIPSFLLCPSTWTLVGACTVSIVCYVKWSFLYSDSPTDIGPFPFTVLLITMKWGRFWESLQLMAPVALWSCYVGRGFGDLLFWVLMPNIYAKLVEAQRERWTKKIPSDEETGVPAELNEQAPLTGRAFVRDGNGAYVEFGDGHPGRESCRALYEEVRSNQ